ncbi:hypothetical protein AB0R99_00310, partial [Erwinia amylovora]|uniref:hypothetical protein n=1 Tax=Erwinia amylovora TaxID=552 RepID=UPI0037DC9F45
NIEEVRARGGLLYVFAEALMPSPNGFATLQLPPGEYQFRISNGRQTRSQIPCLIVSPCSC